MAEDTTMVIEAMLLQDTEGSFCRGSEATTLVCSI